MELALFILAGLVLSTFLVKRTHKKVMKLEITYLQALKLVLIRSAVALGAGFLIGRGFGYAIEQQWLTIDSIRQNPVTVILVMGVCGILSFLAYQVAVNRQSGEGNGVSIFLTMRAVFSEFIYLFVFAAISLVCIASAIGLFQYLTA